MTIRLTWEDKNQSETGHRVYRSDAPMHLSALPEPLAELGANVTSYDDTTVEDGMTYYYRVSAVKPPIEAVSEEIMVIVNDGGSETLDPHYASVVALCHFEGLTNVTTVTDETGTTWQVFGNTHIREAAKKIGNSSIFFDGTGDYITAPSTDGRFWFGTGDFTFEFFMMPTSSKTCNIFSWAANAAIYRNSANPNLFVQVGGTNIFIVPGAENIINEWCHVALTRQAGVYRIFTNGILRGTAASTHDFPEYQIDVGRRPGSSNMYQGYIDELRITKGVCRYTEDFTVPTAPYPAG